LKDRSIDGILSLDREDAASAVEFSSMSMAAASLCEMVRQKVAAAASDKQALQTYKDAEALLQIQDEMHRLTKLNNDLTEEVRGLTVQIHDLVCVHAAPSRRPVLP
jgi:hypothetical protein